MTTKTRTPLTVEDLLAGYNNPEWNGHGYLAERRTALESTDPECPPQPERVAQADAHVVAEANRLGWTRRDLFEWSDSRPGRFYGDAWFGGATEAQIESWMGDLVRDWNRS